MNGWLIAPLLLTVIGVAGASFLPRLASPATCARVLTAIAMASAAGLLAGVVLVVLASVGDHDSMVGVMGWCAALIPGHHGAARWVSALAVVALTISTLRAWRYLARVRHDQNAFADVRGVEVVPASGPVAFAVPGAAGGVVLGDELVRSLDPDERRVVLAHERAHLDLHHHRFVRISELCAAAVPVLVPIARQVRHSTERWADEAAADAVGSRRLVARTIARVALLGEPAGSTPLGLAFGGPGSLARVDALLQPPTGDLRATTGMAVAVLAVTLAGSSVQVHHLMAFLLHACLG